MRIAQLARPFVPVPPRTYGGTERVVSILTEQLVQRGHDVTLFASGDSVTSLSGTTKPMSVTSPRSGQSHLANWRPD
jgi:hypothetical protein